MIEELYKKYGELTIKMRILQAQLQQIEQQIAQELNKQKLSIPDISKEVK